MKLALLVPVKGLDNAKQRLEGFLTGAERTRLVLLMLEGVLAECARVEPGVRRVMATNDSLAMDVARAHGFEVLEEGSQTSESDSVDRASAILEGQGVGGVLRVPLDLPLLDAAELTRIIELARAGLQAVIVPSLDGTGTNGLYRAPPTVFPSRFGPGSLALHEALARERTSGYEVVSLPSLALDIDEPADVGALLETRESSAAKAYLEEIGAGARLREFENR